MTAEAQILALVINQLRNPITSWTGNNVGGSYQFDRINNLLKEFKDKYVCNAYRKPEGNYKERKKELFTPSYNADYDPEGLWFSMLTKKVSCDCEFSLDLRDNLISDV